MKNQEYKPPAAKDIPQDFRVNMIQSLNKTRNSFSGKGITKSNQLIAYTQVKSTDYTHASEIN